MPVRTIDRSKEFVKENESVMEKAFTRMGGDMVLLTRMFQPYKDGKLSAGTSHKKIGKLKHRVVVDEDHASYQERGKRKDGSHVVRKYTTPNTGAHFLARAGQKIAENTLNYIKQAANSIRLR